MPLMQISSTAIRRRLASGLPIRYLVPDAVAEQIAETRPYRTPAEPGAQPSRAPATAAPSAREGGRMSEREPQALAERIAAIAADRKALTSA